LLGELARVTERAVNFVGGYMQKTEIFFIWSRQLPPILPTCLQQAASADYIGLDKSAGIID
jgi:hypothetical protein